MLLPIDQRVVRATNRVLEQQGLRGDCIGNGVQVSLSSVGSASGMGVGGNTVSRGGRLKKHMEYLITVSQGSVML